jgi:hypothetical protein
MFFVLHLLHTPFRIKYLLLKQSDNSNATIQQIDTISELAVCWLENPQLMIAVLQKLECILAEMHSSGTTYVQPFVINPILYL